MIDQDFEFENFFSSKYIDLTWMKNAPWVIRLETRKYLEKEIPKNKQLRKILRELTDVFNGKKVKFKKYNVNNLLMEEFQKIVSSNLNVLIHLSGKTGSGKSEMAQKLAFLLLEQYILFAKANPKHPKAKNYKNAQVNVVFTLEEANNQLKEMNFGDILIRDEQSKASGEGSRTENDRNDNLKKAIRGNNLNFIDCQPGIDSSPMLNFIIMTLGYNTNTKINIAIVFIPVPGNKMDQTVLHPIGYILLKLHSKTKFRKQYEIKKQEYNDNLQKLGGMETISLKKDDIMEDSYAMMKYIEESEMYPESSAEYDLIFAFAKIPSRNTFHQRRVIAFTKMTLKKEGKLNGPDLDQKSLKTQNIDLENLFAAGGDNSDPFLNFKFDELAALESYQSDQKGRDLEIYANRHMKNTELAIDYTISSAWVGQIILQVEGYLDYLRGHAFEKFAAGIYKQLGYEILTDLDQTALKGQSDLVVKKDGIIEILSLKCSVSIKKTIKPIEDCKPEILEFLDRKKNSEDAVKLYLEFINLQTMDHRKQELNEKNLQHIKSIPLY